MSSAPRRPPPPRPVLRPPPPARRAPPRPVLSPISIRPPPPSRRAPVRLNPIPLAKTQFGDLPPELIESVVGPMLRGVDIGRVAQTSKSAQKKILPFLDPQTIGNKKALVEAMCRHLTDGSHRCLSRADWPLDSLPKQWAEYARDHKLDSLSCGVYCAEEWPQHIGKAFVDTMMANINQKVGFLFVAVPVDSKPVDLPLFTGKLASFDVVFSPGAMNEHQFRFEEEESKKETSAPKLLPLRGVVLQKWKEEEKKGSVMQFKINLKNTSPNIAYFYYKNMMTGIVKQIPATRGKQVIWPDPMRVVLDGALADERLKTKDSITLSIKFPLSASPTYRTTKLEARRVKQVKIYPPAGFSKDPSYYQQFF
jgi:hypothetical protein